MRSDRKLTVAYTVARHRKPARFAQPPATLPRHRKPSRSRLTVRPATVRASSLVVITFIAAVAAGVMLLHLPARVPAASAAGLPRVSGRGAVFEAGSLVSVPDLNELLMSRQPASPATTQSAAPVQTAPAIAGGAPQPTGYLNPLRSVSGLIAQRIDMGVDFVGTGPVYAIGDAVITNAEDDNSGWPGGGWITYQLTDGPAAGLMVYVAEDVTPAVQVGDHVTASTVIGSMSGSSEGIETGWAMPDGASAESQLAAAGGIGGNGPFPTEVGVNFDELLVALGVPSAPNLGDQAYGLLPPNYPAQWPQLAS